MLKAIWKFIACKVIGLCDHDWSVVDERNVSYYDCDFGDPRLDIPVSRGKIFFYRCSKCGKVKSKRIRY